MKYLLALFAIVCFSAFSNSGINHSNYSKDIVVDRYQAIDTFVHSSRIVVLDYWFMGCASCKKSIPEMNQIAQTYEKRGVKFYGLNPIDDPAKIEMYKQKNAVTYHMFPISFDLAKKCSVYEYPTVVVYKDNKVAMTFEGYSIISAKQISDFLDKLLK